MGTYESKNTNLKKKNRGAQVGKQQFGTHKSKNINRETTILEIPSEKITDECTSENTNWKSSTREIRIGSTDRQNTIRKNTTREIHIGSTNHKNQARKYNSKNLIKFGKYKSENKILETQVGEI